MADVIGIDLGTTNSCVAVVEGGAPVVIPNREGYKTTPSIVALTEDSRQLTGITAKRQAITNARNTVFACKRLIGRRWDSSEVQSAIETVPYGIEEGPHGDARVRLRGKMSSVQEMAARVLREMKIAAVDYLGTAITQAVVTVPAYFNDNQRQATRVAGRMAGLDVVRIINEPTAAALAYGFGKHMERKVAVYDWGGGTFDISIVDIGEGVLDVVRTAGDTFLGGEDFDCRIIDWLSSVTEAEIHLPFIITTGTSDAVHLRRIITRQKLEELTADLMDRTIQICRRTMEEAGIHRSEIDDVILVGGMTRMPKVQEAVASFFGREPCRGVHPDEVVALGAAIQGAALLGKESEILLLDVTPHSLGIMVAGEKYHKVVEQNTTVPTSATHSFTTARDNQTSVKIVVMQGGSLRAEENELLGEFVLTGLRSAPKGEVEIGVTFDINADGVVSVSARDVDTGKQQSIAVTASSGLTEDEIRDIIRDSGKYLVNCQ
jgi:molecular chaperone DnaK